jgi:uncharacterized protein (TIGR00369 family)
MTFEPVDPDYVERVRSSFSRQRAMASFGIELFRILPGEVAVRLEFRPELTQQHGFLHAGVIATALDSACGYAAFTLMPPAAGVLTVEYKVNLLAPARGDHFEVVGTVVKPGRTITVCNGSAWAVDGESRSLMATMTCTLMTILDRPGIEL